MAYPKTTMRRRRRSTKKAPVSKKIQNYVKKAIKKDKDLYIIEDSAIENTASTLSSPWWMDLMMYRGSRLEAIIGAQDVSVQSVGLKVNYVIHNNNTSSFPTHIRLLVLEVRETYNTDYRSGTNMFDLMPYNTTTSGLRSYNATTYDLTTRINPDKYKVHYDKTITVGPVPSTPNPLQIWNDAKGKIWVPYRKMLKYEQATASFPINGHLAFVAISVEGPNDVSLGHVLEVTAVGSWYFRH